MKKLFIMIVMVFSLISCAEFNAVMDITDIFIKDTAIYSGQVEYINYGRYSDTIFFIDGNKYEINKNNNINKGDILELFLNKDGQYSANVKE